jgi:hypothetical protein
MTHHDHLIQLEAPQMISLDMIPRYLFFHTEMDYGFRERRRAGGRHARGRLETGTAPFITAPFITAPPGASPFTLAPDPTPAAPAAPLTSFFSETRATTTTTPTANPAPTTPFSPFNSLLVLFPVSFLTVLYNTAFVRSILFCTLLYRI